MTADQPANDRANRLDRAAGILDRALELGISERLAYLEGACGGDDSLRHEVEAMLAAHEEAGDFLAAPTRLGPDAIPAAPSEQPGTLIDRYKLLELIGEGGFGAVYMAQQTEPVRRKVALKIIKLGMDTKQVIARFDAERQALAMMDHPNIAKVLDAGATEAGRPYFVMELVKGVPITEYCDTENLATNDRLDLMTRVCNAVQHAHQKGVIHRDIKPSNVMVTIADGKPIPKVIDFGIAKATDGTLTDKTLFTEFRQLIGTPAYMSPEQAEMSGVDIDTRSDIYSLGVLLYELLTGTTPFDPQRLRSAAFGEMQRIIREEDPEKPSTRVASDLRARRSSEPHPSGSGRSEPQAQAPGSSSPRKKPIASAQGSSAFSSLVSRSPFPDPSSAITIAKHRRSDPARLTRELRGDLDWIVMKCLEKDRTRRYETANGVAADIQRHLHDEPVEAGPPTAAYRVRKFVRRNRAMVTAATMVVAALLAGTAGTTFGLLRAEQRRADAEAARGREREQRELAEKREKQTQQVADFQAAMLSEIDVEAMGRGIKEHLREQVRAALERQYMGEFPDRRQRTPEEIEAELAAFDQRADLAQAADVARGVMDEFVLARAADALEEQFGDQPLVQAQLHLAIGRTYRKLGLYDAAEPHLRKALEGRRRVLGDDDPDTLSSISNMGLLLEDQGKPAEAEPYCREALEGRRRALGDEHRETLISIDNMGSVLQAQGRLAEAKPYYREALEGFRRVLGDDHPDTLTAINNMGNLLKAQRRLDEAEPYHREALEGRRRVLGDEHPSTLASISNMGDLLHYQGKLAEAEPYYREALEESRRILGDEHPDTLISLNNMAYLVQDQGRRSEALSLFAEGSRAARAGLGDHPTTAMIEHHYADVLRETGRVDEAIDLAQSAVDRYRAHPDWSPREAAHAHSVLARALVAAGRLAEAEPHYREALAGNRRVLGDEDPTTLSYNYAMGFLLVDLGRPAEAEPYYREALEGRRRVLGEEHPATLDAINEMAFVLQAQGKYAEAEPYYRGALEIRRRVSGDEHPDTLTSIHNMGFWLSAQGRPAEAEPYYREALETGRRVLGDDHPDLFPSIHAMGSVLRAQGKLAEAEPYFRDVLEKCRRVLGDKNPGTLRSLNGMGGLLQDQRKPAEAEAYFREALKTGRRVLGDEHPITLTSINSMGMLLRDLGRLSEAESLFADGTRAARAGLGDHPTTGAIEHHYADVLREAGRVDEAIDLAQTAVDRYRAHPDWPPDEAAHAREVLAEALLDVGDQAFLEQAEEAARESLEIRRTVLPEDHPRVWLRYNSMSLLGDALVRQASEPSLAVEARMEKLREAEPLLLEAWENLKDDPNVPPPSATGGESRRHAALERIVRLYDAWHAAEPDAGHDAQADEWRTELEKLDG